MGMFLGPETLCLTSVLLIASHWEMIESYTSLRMLTKNNVNKRNGFSKFVLMRQYDICQSCIHSQDVEK